MSYQHRIREIMSSFVMGHQDRETCISRFEALMHEYQLLPVTEHIDRTISNENFLAMLKAAKEHKADSHQKDMRHAPAMDAITRLIFPEHNIIPDRPGHHYRIADSVTHHCPVCEKPCQGVYNSMKTLDQQVFPVDPPRCHACMVKWIEEKFGTAVVNSSATVAKESHTAFTRDTTEPGSMSPDEFDFFKQYEQEMDGFKP